MTEHVFIVLAEDMSTQDAGAQSPTAVNGELTPSALQRKVYEMAKSRAGGNCEAIIEIPMGNVIVSPRTPKVMARCGRGPVEIHHRITRGRGGEILDRFGEHRHLMALCRRCHNAAHDQRSAFDNGLLIAGTVVMGPQGRPVYTGPDETFNERYGA